MGRKVIRCSGDAVCKLPKGPNAPTEMRKCLGGRPTFTGHCGLIRRDVTIKEDFSYEQ